MNLTQGFCNKCSDNILKPVIGKRQNALCQTHYWESKRQPLPVNTTPIKKDTSYVIPKVTKKQAQRNTQYLKQRGLYLLAHPYCVIIAEGCTYIASTIHHGFGRIGDNLTDETGFVECCMSCHQKCEKEPLWAKENGFSFERLKTTK